MFNLQRTAIAVAAGVSVLGLTACDPSQFEPTPTPAPRLVEATETQWVAPTSVMPVQRDPYKSNGTWRVPSQIAPGDYQVIITDTDGSGYWAICADAGCAIDGDGSDFTGMIDNGFIFEDDYLHVPPHAFSIKLRGVELVAVA
ncbi:hypothetical protein IU421_14980 [Nocardia cyriacigeorgica]|uniref:hypothetical protein n=1 Tax=Nocardia cyriacigeorgica TaxID=135487 RepID=UPI001895B914|nr:hypothetical protein [Nocardia cyriacigeorgica]MBF6515575.1 hypothetical protein [Nocardia cyriacigeorgica]